MEKQEVRFAVQAIRSKNDAPVLEGEIPFNSYSVPGVPIAGCREKLAPRCFTNLKTAKRIWFLYQHDLSNPLGSTTNSTFSLDQTDSAVRFTVRPNMNIRSHAEAVEAVRSGLLDSISFGFVVDPDGDEYTQDGNGMTRTIRKASIFELSLVSEAAYPAATVSARAYLPRSFSERDVDAANKACLAYWAKKLGLVDDPETRQLKKRAADIADVIMSDEAKYATGWVRIPDYPGAPESACTFRPETAEERKAREEADFLKSIEPIL